MCAQNQCREETESGGSGLPSQPRERLRQKDCGEFKGSLVNLTVLSQNIKKSRGCSLMVEFSPNACKTLE